MKKILIIILILILICAAVGMIYYFQKKSEPVAQEQKVEETTQMESIGEVEKVEVESNPDIDENTITITNEENNKTETLLQNEQRNVRYNNESRHGILVNEEKNEYLTFGIDSAEIDDAFYINPLYNDDSDVAARYGFYIDSDVGKIECSNSEYASVDDEKYMYRYSYVIMDRTYDTLVPATFEDTNDYGVRWRLTENESPEDNKKATIYLRVINLDSNMFVQSIRIELTYDSETQTYSVSQKIGNDVSYSSIVPPEVREAVIDDTVRFFSGASTQIALWNVSAESWEQMRDRVIVELVPHPYFDKMYTIESRPVRSLVYDKYTVLAVNYPLEEYGVITAYFVPAEQLRVSDTKYIKDYQPYYVDRAGNQTPEPFVITGYDALMPFSREIFRTNLIPDDEDFFLTDLSAETLGSDDKPLTSIYETGVTGGSAAPVQENQEATEETNVAIQEEVYDNQTIEVTDEIVDIS